MLNEALRKIAKVQTVDTAIQELQRRFSAIDPGRGPKASEEASRMRLEEAEGELKAVRSEIEDLELKTKSMEQKIASEKNRLYSGGVYNAKDAEAIEREIANIMQRRGAADDRILELWDLVEPKKQAVEVAKAAHDAAAARLTEYEAKYRTVRAEFEQKASQLVEAKKRAIAGCNLALLAKYEANRKKHGGIGIAAVVDGVCSACNTSVPKKQLGDIKAGDTLETCENCLRYLYLPEEAPVT
ncbi:MAG TPA: C4-type zinc ribbon domain-containing protein [Fimbriimonadales bacterium]|jgi:predicted  nucleic acid-binding Zn-ribbon protein|nr:C4-type zinc ribbon domain-containing protein [Fimbriimonadales bacterium]